MILILILILREDFMVRILLLLSTFLWFLILLGIGYASTKICITFALVHRNVLHLDLLNFGNFTFRWFTWWKSPLRRLLRTFFLTLNRFLFNLLKLSYEGHITLFWNLLLFFYWFGFMLWFPGRPLFNFPQIFRLLIHLINLYTWWLLWYRLPGHILVRFWLCHTRIFFSRL